MRYYRKQSVSSGRTLHYLRRFDESYDVFNKSTLLDEVDMCLVDLGDKDFTWEYELSDYSQFNTPSYILDISLYKVDKSSFNMDSIKDSIETMIEYFDEKYGVKSYFCSRPNSPGPGIEIKLYVDEDDVVARHKGYKLSYLNIKINLGK